jgi:chromosome partitioning protein
MPPTEEGVPPVLAVANQKGGVGKTTTATCLAHGLAMTGRRVLVVDIDPQGNATSGMGVDPVPQSAAFADRFSPDSVVPTPWPGVSAIPAGHDLERLAVHGLPSRDVLHRILGALPAGLFDAILIDCPPSLGPLTQNALAAATSVLVPIQCEYYPLEGLVQLLGAVRQSAVANPALAIAGVLFTMYDPAADLSREVEAEVRGKLSEPVFRTVIPRDVAVAEAPSHCRSVIDYAPRSPGARGYMDLTLEVLARGLLDTSHTEAAHA